MRLSPLRALALTASVLALSGMAASATAKSSTKSDESGWDRAVSAPNLKVSGYGGAEDGQVRANIAAEGSIPVGDNFGLQIDGLYGYGDDNENGGVGGHFFYRDPKKFLAGVTAMTAKQDSTEFSRYGVESEIYLDQFTLSTAGGYQDGDDRLGNSGFYTAEGAFYPNDNLKYTLGITGFEDNTVGYGRTEWQPNNEPYTLFAFGGSGDNGNAFILAGASYTFGANNSTLKKRDRTGDPENIVKTAATYVGSAINNAANRVNQVVGNSFNNVGNKI